MSEISGRSNEFVARYHPFLTSQNQSPYSFGQGSVKFVLILGWFLLPPPLQFIPQNIKIVPVLGLDEVESRAAFSDAYAIA